MIRAWHIPGYLGNASLKALPKLAKAANSDQLRNAFQTHHGETEGQVGRLEEIFELIRKPARDKTCDAILGILDEGKEVMEEFEDSPALDAGLLAGAQAVEHYEISRYGTLKTWASELGLSSIVTNPKGSGQSIGNNSVRAWPRNWHFWLSLIFPMNSTSG